MGTDTDARHGGVLIITAHPDPDSLSRTIARALAEALAPEGAEVADLADEGFDPRFGPDDRATYVGRAAPPADVVAEQERIDAVTDLVLVFPVHWWTLPAQLKGWIDRVFIAGWAFDGGEDGVVPLLGRLRIHLIPVAGSTEESFARHGYTAAFAAQVEHGIVEFCGARRGATAFVHDSSSGDRTQVSRTVETVAAAVRSPH